MTALLLARRFLTETARNPVTILMLVVVPVVFVVVAASAMEEAARALSYHGGPSARIATVGWAAGFIAANAMYFQIRAARAADRRLVLAGLPPSRLVAARMASGLSLALLAAAAAVIALAAHSGTGDLPGRVVAGALMYAVIYLAVGALVGALAAGPVNGIMLVLFVWILDVVFGPAYGSADRLGTRFLPTHYVTLWMTDQPSAHAGPVGALGWSLLWTAAALAAGWLVIMRVTRIARPPGTPPRWHGGGPKRDAGGTPGPAARPDPHGAGRRPPPGTRRARLAAAGPRGPRNARGREALAGAMPAPPRQTAGTAFRAAPARYAAAAGRPGAGQLAAGLRIGLREAARNRTLWVLLVAVPSVFIWLAVLTSPKETAVLTLHEGGRMVPKRFWLPDIHGGIMAPIAIASLAAIAGLFTVLDARSGDRRLVLAGFRAARLLAARLAVVALLALVATAASLAVTATVFDARQWGLYIAANTLIALTYALVGVLLGPLFGRVAGVFVAFLVSFIDLGIEQSPIIHPRLSGWSECLPGYGGSRVLFDAALTPGFDDTTALLYALAWLAGLVLAVIALFGRSCAPPGGRPGAGRRAPGSGSR